LEAVGKRIKERGARVGEKVAGRLAEGVHLAAALISSVILTSSRSCRVLHTSIQRSSFTETLNLLMSSFPARVS